MTCVYTHCPYCVSILIVQSSVEDPDPVVVIDEVLDPDNSFLYIIISLVKYKRYRNYISKLIVL